MHDAPACVTVKVEPAIVSVPVRAAVDGFAATLNLTVPGPDPKAPEVIVIHELLVVAFQAQPVAVVTVPLAVPPPAANDTESGETANVQAVPVPKENVLLRAPPLRPPGPTASTLAS